jgi:hypothetical protein
MSRSSDLDARGDPLVAEKRRNSARERQDLLDLDALAGGNPLVAGAAGELVHAVVASDQGGGARAIEHDDGGDLSGEAEAAQHSADPVRQQIRCITVKGGIQDTEREGGRRREGTRLKGNPVEQTECCGICCSATMAASARTKRATRLHK